MKIVVFVAAILLALTTRSAQADFILNCEEISNTIIEWKPEIRAVVSSRNTPKKPMRVTLAQIGTSAFLKGNLGDTPLTPVSPYQFAETTLTGNVVLWSVFSKHGEVPPIVYQHKAYDLGGPFTITVAFRCE